MSDAQFDACLPFTLKQECNVYTGTAEDWSNPKNFDDDPHDPGSETQCGITNDEYQIFLQKAGFAAVDIRGNITQAQGNSIYYGSYWLPNCPKLPPGLNLVVFDENVNAGPGRSTMLLQGALGITVDGIWGPQTDAAVKAITDPSAIIDKFTAEREAYYRSLSTFQYFGDDWIRRSQQIAANANTLVGSVA